MVNQLADIEIATKLLSAEKLDVHPIDQKYLSLNCDLKPLVSVLGVCLAEMREKSGIEWGIQFLPIFVVVVIAAVQGQGVGHCQEVRARHACPHSQHVHPQGGGR